MLEKSESKIEMYIGQTKWAELAAWETFDDVTKKEIIQQARSADHA
jgi:hypothetical protein